ncbi:unnamed protein product, partial [Rotaria socialis]
EFFEAIVDDFGVVIMAGRGGAFGATGVAMGRA